MICDMDCLHCKFSDCINDSDIISSHEREISNRTDTEILEARVPVYISTRGCRPYKVRPHNFSKSQARYFSRKNYYKDVDKSREQGRENYYKHRETRKATMRRYYSENKETLLNQKKAYYEEHKEEILKSRKENYVPHLKQVIDTPEAQLKREREKARYEANKEEINRKRRERRRQRNADSKKQSAGNN